MWRVSSSIRPTASAAVALPNAGVPQTTTPSRLGGIEVDRGIAHSGGDEELQIGQRLDHRARKDGALAHGADDGKALQRRDDLVLRAEMFIEHPDLHVALDLRPIGKSERDVLIIVENCAAQRHEYRLLGRARRRLITAFGRQASDEQQTAGNALGPRLGGGVLCCGGRQGAGRLACHFGPGPRI